MANSIYNYCLVCSEVLSSTNFLHLDKFDTVFLLIILLEIPQDSQLINQAYSTLKSLSLCKLCGVIVKQCKEVYSEISAFIQKFWGLQNTILRKIQKDEHIPAGYNSKQYSLHPCRQLVKNSNVEVFKYPFVFHDLTKLMDSFPGSHLITDPFAVLADVKMESSTEIRTRSIGNTSGLSNSIGQTLNPLPVFPSTLNRIDLSCKISSNGSYSVFENADHFNYYENNRNFNKTIPLDDQIPSTSWENLNIHSSTTEIPDPLMTENDDNIFKEEPQFEDENDDDNDSHNHDESFELTEEDDYSNGCTCSWPGCGEQLRDETSLSCHMDRHRGTPKQKCEQCSHLFYSLPDLLTHQKTQHAKSTNNLSDISIKGFVESEEEYSSDNYEMEKPSSEESVDGYIATPKQVSEESQACVDLNAGRQQSEYTLVRHPITGKNYYICSWPGCEKRVANHTTMLAHLDQHKGTPQWKCEHCPHQTYWRSMLVKHLQRKHGIIKSKCDRGELLKKYQFILDTTTGKYSCPEKTCNKSYKNLRMVKEHFKEKHLKVKEKLVLNPTTRKFEKQDNLKIKEKKGLVCEFDECSGRSFSTKISWQSHMDKHMGTPRQKCEKCGQLFYWIAELFRHQKKLHPKGTNN